MTIELVCECGTVLHAPDEAAGRQGRCRDCGRMIRVPTPEEQLAARDRQLDPRYARRSGLDEREGAHAPTRGFWADAAAGFLLCRKSGNFIMVAVLTALLTLASVFNLGPFLFARIIQLAVWGYVFAFLFSVIVETAAGEDELPLVDISGMYDGVFVPLVQYWGSWLGVMMPALVLGFLAWYFDRKVLWYCTYGAAAIGAFIWPAAILLVAIGGSAAAAFHLDLIFGTIVSSFGAYLLTLLMIALAMLPSYGVPMLLKESGGPGGIGGAIFVAVLLRFVTIYSWTVAMRCVGLYYRHFKSRFPWSAG